MRQQDALYRLLETTLLLNQTQQEREILAEILKAIRYVMNAKASSLLLLDSSTNDLYFHTFEGGSADVREIRLKLGEGIAGWVAKYGKPLIINDVSKDRRFTGRVDKATGFSTRNILCVPLRTGAKTLGVIEAINKKQGGFSAADQKIFSAFAAQAAIALENARLYSLAFVDALTGAYGRRYFETWLANEFARAKRYQSDFSLAIVDLDNFKLINDRHSHLAGDYVLSETSKIIKSAIRTSDIFARYGGEEFALIMPHTSMKSSATVVERARLAIQNHNFSFAGKPLRASASVGVAGFNACRPKTTNEMILLADKALYEAKHSGRNQVVCAPQKSARLKP